jgi:uncharacterized protein (DUF305 family)
LKTKPSRTRLVWRAALLTGLLTSMFSSLVNVLGSHHIGLGVAVSLMDVGLVLLGYDGARVEPGLREVGAGLLVHQSADVFWAVVFFGLVAKWTLRLGPGTVLALAPVWAAATAAVEYYALLPWLQPLLRMQTPYWVAFGVHLSSAAAYPLHFWVRRIVPRPEHADRSGFGRATAVALGGVLLLLGAAEALCESGRLPYLSSASGSRREFDQSFLRKMTVHHEVGVRMSLLAAEMGESEELRMLGRLMTAEQVSEIERMDRWWRSCFGGEIPQISHSELGAVAGMPPPGAVEELARMSGAPFEARFVDLMVPHHEGAVAMSDDAWERASDPRLRQLADQIQHAQRAQIARMKALRSPPPGDSKSLRAVVRCGDLRSN